MLFYISDFLLFGKCQQLAEGYFFMNLSPGFHLPFMLDNLAFLKLVGQVLKNRGQNQNGCLLF